MGLFSSKKAPAPEPIRRDQVRRLIKAGMVERDAGDRGVDTPEFRKAWAERGAATRDCTQAEIRAAHEALKRHGY